MTLIGGLPAHPLIIHAVVVLLPLAALGTLAVAASPRWRRNLGGPVFLVALAGVLAVPLATRTGEQLEEVLGGQNPLVEIHEERAETLLPVALLYLALLAAALLLGRRADRTGATAGGPGKVVVTAVSVLAALAGLVVAGLVVWIGHAGATAAWQGVVGR